MKPRAQAEQKPDDERFICDVSRSEFKHMTDVQWDELKEYCKSGFSGGIDNAIMDLEIELKGGYETDTEQEQEQEPSEPLLATGQEQEEEQEQDGGESELFRYRVSEKDVLDVLDRKRALSASERRGAVSFLEDYFGKAWSDLYEVSDLLALSIKDARKEAGEEEEQEQEQEPSEPLLATGQEQEQEQ